MERIDLRAIFKGQPEYALFLEPKPGESVWPHQGCPCWAARRYTLLTDPDHECWCCKYADFHLNQDKALEVGICKYSKK